MKYIYKFDKLCFCKPSNSYFYNKPVKKHIGRPPYLLSKSNVSISQSLIPKLVLNLNNPKLFIPRAHTVVHGFLTILQFCRRSTGKLASFQPVVHAPGGPPPRGLARGYGPTSESHTRDRPVSVKLYSLNLIVQSGLENRFRAEKSRTHRGWVCPVRHQKLCLFHRILIRRFVRLHAIYGATPYQTQLKTCNQVFNWDLLNNRMPWIALTATLIFDDLPLALKKVALYK